MSKDHNIYELKFDSGKLIEKLNIIKIQLFYKLMDIHFLNIYILIY